MKTLIVDFREIIMPCCHNQLSWVGSRLPNYCPECGAKVYKELKFNPSHTMVFTKNARLNI